MTEEVKATARHEKMAKAKREKLEQLEMKVSSDKNSIGKIKEERKADIKKLPKEQQPAEKEKLAAEIAEIKERIAATKEEIKALKAEIRDDEAHRKEYSKE